ncbi:peroxisomal biogenesis factor 19-like [Uloborus diversus]|uniref:peroxisomal biogenesis factor 19-like n=1 Tax=Uloborus diversus TaxID=327109 RepID=UPI0024099F95|nr:peroxisomal biogenesis factor 19-like [Uloborus diversus]
MEQKDKEAKASADENLDDLLDSCINDFDRPLPKKSSSGNQETSSCGSIEAKATSTASSAVADNASWSEEFQQFSEVMENFLENESELNEFKNLMGTLNQGGPITDENFAESFAETIRGLTAGAQNIPEPTPEELANLFSGFGLNDPSDTDEVPEFMPLMQNVMQKLMSKELLYPSLKEIVDKYPQWLTDNKPSLKEEEYETYTNQFQLMKKVCEEFEEDKDDNEESKKKSFETVLQLMQKIQGCGNPPKELVSDMNQGVPLDEHGNIQIPGMPQQCSIM